MDSGGVATEIEFFANPVKKTEPDGAKPEEISDENTHLTWYRLEKLEEENVHRVVTFENQFGVQEWLIGEAVYLIVPTEKLEEGSSEPDNSKHFKCYKVLEVLSGDIPGGAYHLQDQFGEQDVNIMEPVYFCNPVEKNGEARGEGHLACYMIPPEQVDNRVVKIKNQFEVNTNELILEESHMLCVPSEKKGFEERKGN